MWGKVGQEQHARQAPDELQAALAIERNPFAPELDDALFFPAAQHQQFLELLRHLSRYSNLLLTVTGPAGVGKTSLRRRLLLELDLGVQACELDAALAASAAQLLAGLVQLLDLDVDANADLPTYIERIQRHIELLHDDGRSCLIVLDNAHELTEDAIELILQLAAVAEDRRRPHFILLGRPELLPHLNRPEIKHRYQAIGHHLELAPLPAAEVIEYLEYRCRAAGLEPLPFDDAQLAQIQQYSGGLPARINEAAARLLHVAESPLEPSSPPSSSKPSKKKQVSATKRAGKPASGVPIWHISALLLVGAVLTVLFMYQEEPDERVIELELPAQAAPDLLAAVNSAPPVAQPAPAEAALPTAPPVPEPEPIAVAPSSPPPAPEPAPVREISQARPEPVAPEVTPPPSPAPSIATAPAAAAPVSAPPAAAPVVAAKPAATPPATPAPRTEPARSRYKKEAELLRLDPRSYTMQMLGARAERSAIDFIERQADRSQLSYFETLYKGQPWFVVVYGQYPNREAAVAAIARLPSSLRQQRPWVRSLASVHKDIRLKQ